MSASTPPLHRCCCVPPPVLAAAVPLARNPTIVGFPVDQLDRLGVVTAYFGIGTYWVRRCRAPMGCSAPVNVPPRMGVAHRHQAGSADCLC